MTSPTRHTRAMRFALFALTFALASLLTYGAHAVPGPWTLGIQTRGFIDFEPGNDYVTGLDAGYAPERVFGADFRHRLEMRAAYLTSRGEAAYRNVLRQDWFLLSPVWHLRPRRFFDPTLQLDFGWQRYDVENEAIFGDLENSAGIIGVQVGFQLNFWDRYAVRYSLGYQAASTASSVVYPLPFTLGLAVAFP